MSAEFDYAQKIIINHFYAFDYVNKISGIWFRHKSKKKARNFYYKSKIIRFVDRMTLIRKIKFFTFKFKLNIILFLLNLFKNF